MSVVFRCLFGCLAPKQKPDPVTQSKELSEIQCKLERSGSHTTAFTHDRSTSFGPKQSLSHKLSTLQRTEHYLVDNDKHPTSDDERSKSLDKLPEEASKTQLRSENSKISAQTIQLDYITVDYKPKNTVITRSLPQFEPERKSRFASVSLNADLKKSQSTKAQLSKSAKSQTRIPKPEKKDPKLKMSKSGTLGGRKKTPNKYRY